jgi:HK97 family phage major capsid protein
VNANNYEFMNSANLRAEKTKLIQELDKIHTRSKENKDGSLSKDDQYIWDSNMDQVNILDYHIREAVVREAQNQEAALILDKRNVDQFRNKSGKASRSNNLLGRIIKSAHSQPDDEVRSLTSTSGTKLIPESRISDVIFDLTSQNQLFDGAGARAIEAEQNLQYPSLTGYPTHHWQSAELQQIPDSAPVFSGIKVSLKDIAVRIIVSNQLLIDADVEVSAVLQQAMITAINQAILEAAFSGSGASGQPTGLDNLANVLTVDAQGDKLTNYRFHIEAVKKLLDANILLPNISFFASADSWSQLESLTDSTGQPLRAPSSISDLRKFYTSAIKTDYGTDNNKTKVYAGDFSRMVMAYQPAMQIYTDQNQDRLASTFITHFRLDFLYLSNDSFARIDNIETGLPEYGI